MGKQRVKFTRKELARRISAGYGQGCGVQYRPLFEIHDVRTDGFATRPPRNLVGEGQHHLLSTVELCCFLELQWKLLTLKLADDLGRGEVKEQYYLDLDETLDIAREMGVRHPMVGRTLWPVTTDLVGEAAVNGHLCMFPVTCKPVGRLTRRAIAKLEIERRYWVRRGWSLRLFTERDVDTPLIQSLRLVWPFFSLSGVTNPPEEWRPVLTAAWRTVIETPDRSGLLLSEACSVLDASFQLLAGAAQAQLFHLIANQRIRTDFSTSFDLRRPVHALSWNGGDAP
jgi:TnsA-like endonuclease N terminal